jgi:hypothetical protein
MKLETVMITFETKLRQPSPNFCGKPRFSTFVRWIIVRWMIVLKQKSVNLSRKSVEASQSSPSRGPALHVVKNC